MRNKGTSRTILTTNQKSFCSIIEHKNAYYKALLIDEKDVVYSLEEGRKGDVPVTILEPKSVNDKGYNKTLRALLDSGASITCIKRKALPKGCVPHRIKGCNVQGFGGEKVLNEVLELQQVTLPEFSRSFQIERIQALIIDDDPKYDIILERDVLQPTGFALDFDDGSIRWMDMKIPMKFSNEDEIRYVDYVSDDEEEEELFVTEILSSKYDEVQPKEVAKQQEHLTDDQKNDLENLLMKFPKLFDGKLKKYTGSKVSLTLKHDATPYQSRAYNIPHIHRKLFQEELSKLIKQGVLSRTERNLWSAPTFLIPKKDGRVRWISDFRMLNKNLLRKQYELPRIRDILERRNGYAIFTKLDISMQYYTFELDEASKKLCTIITPFGLFKYNRLPMGVSESPDVAQEIMENVLRDCDCEVYIDDIGVFGTSWNEHVTKLEKVLTVLQDKGFAINPLKCEWGIQETDWLGQWLTPIGIKPWRKKINAIVALQSPKNLRELRKFLGAVNFYKDMWKRRSHFQKSLTDLIGKKNFEWLDIHETAFNKIKSILSTDALLYYPDHNKRFDIWTDSSDYQLGSTIGQRDDEGTLRPVAFFSKKLNKRLTL